MKYKYPVIKKTRVCHLDSAVNGRIGRAVGAVLQALGGKIKEAGAKGNAGLVRVLKAIYELGKKALSGSVSGILSWIKKAGDVIGQKVKDSYDIETKLLYAQSEIKFAAKDAMKKAARAAVKEAMGKKDSLYEDCKTIFRDAVRAYKVVRRIQDDRRRISTTMTPTIWEIRQVLGIKPGVSFNENDWKAYKENGEVVVENRRGGQRYHRPINELVSIANQEKMKIESRKDPYVAGLQEQYSADYISKAERPKIEKALRFIKVILTSISGAVLIINGIGSGTKGWGEKIRKLLARLTLTKQEFIDLESELLKAKASAGA